MGKFKMGNAPYKKDVTPVYQVPFDNPGLVAKANDNGTIIVNKDLVKDKELMSEAMSHEKKHLKDMQDGILSYDSKSVTYKGKKYDRDSFHEGNPNLPWEAPAYKAGKERKKFDLTPNPNKLDGPPSFSPMSFDKLGGKSGRRDEDEVSMNESFGSFMMKKKWGGPSNTLGGSDDEKKKASKSEVKANAEEEAKENAEKDEGKTTVTSSTTTTTGEDEKGEYEDVTTDTETTTRKEGDGKDLTWEERRQIAIDKGWVDPDITLEDYIAKAEADIVNTEKSSNTVRTYKPKTEEKKKEPEPLTPRNIATLLNEYRIKNNVDMTYYDPEKPGGRGRHTPESYYEENDHFRDWVEAQQREAVNAGQDRLDESVYDDVNEGTNITKTPENKNGTSMFKKVPHLVSKMKQKFNG